jgi:hypothetical protein
VAAKYRSEGARGIAGAFAKRVSRGAAPTDHHDHHTWHPAADDVLELLRSVGLEIGHVHWQKPPYTSTVYVQAVKPR